MFKMKSRKEGLMMIDRTYRISDVVNEEFLRFPLILLSNPRYKEMSLEAKFVYALTGTNLSIPATIICKSFRETNEILPSL